MILATERLSLRPLRAEDAGALFAILGDPVAMAFWDREAFARLETVAELVAGEMAAMADGAARYWTAWLGADAIGSLDLSHIDPLHRRAELGFLFRRDMWGQGYACEAAAAVLAQAFGAMGLERLTARIHGDNIRAARLLEDLGFAREGVLRGHVWRGGRRHDCVLYGRLAVQSNNANGR